MLQFLYLFIYFFLISVFFASLALYRGRGCVEELGLNGLMRVEGVGAPQGLITLFFNR